MSDLAVNSSSTLPNNLKPFPLSKSKRATERINQSEQSVGSENKSSTATQAKQEPSVDPTSAEELLTAAGLGQRIKRLRLKRSMGLVELGRSTGLSASFLSQLETGRVVPTLRNLARISIVFGKDLSYFFETESESVFRVQRKKDRVRLTMGTATPSYISESFGILIPEGGLRPCMAEFLPGPERDDFVPERYPGVEMVYVLSGTLKFDRNGEEHELREHDLMYVSGETMRSYRCSGDSSVQTLIVSFDEEPGSLRKAKK